MSGATGGAVRLLEKIPPRVPPRTGASGVMRWAVVSAAVVAIVTNIDGLVNVSAVQPPAWPPRPPASTRYTTLPVAAAAPPLPATMTGSEAAVTISTSACRAHLLRFIPRLPSSAAASSPWGPQARESCLTSRCPDNGEEPFDGEHRGHAVSGTPAALAAGAVTGLRSQLGLAAVVWGSDPSALPLASHSAAARRTTATFALGELV